MIILEYNNYPYSVIVTELEGVEGEICYVTTLFKDGIEIQSGNTSKCPDIHRLIKTVDECKDNDFIF